MRNKLIIVFHFCLSIGAGQTTQQLNSLCGKVVDSSGAELPFATISIIGHNQHQISDDKGRFCFDQSFNQYITLRVQFIGYVTQEVEVQNTTGFIRIILKEDVQHLEEVQVTHDFYKKEKKKGYSVVSINTKAIQAQSISLNQVLNQSSGVGVRQSGGIGSKTNISLNGLGGRAIRFFIDGVPMEYFGSSYSINTIPVSLIDRLDIYKGVVPVSLSNDALGGAVNIVTHKTIKNQLQLSYSNGSFNTHRVSLFSNYRNKKNGLTFKLSSFYNYSDNDYEVWGDKIQITNPTTFVVERGKKVKRFHDGFESKGIHGAVGYTNLKWVNQLFVGLIASDLDKEIQHGSSMEVPYGEATYQEQVITPYLQFDKNDVLLKDVRLKTFTSYAHLTRKHIDTSKNIYNWYGVIEGQRTLGGEQYRTLNKLEQKVFTQRVNLAYRAFRFNYLFSHLKRQDTDPIITQKTEGYWAPQFYDKNTLGLSYQKKWLGDKFNLSLFAKYYSYKAVIKTSEYSKGTPIYYSINSQSATPGYGFGATVTLYPKMLLNVSGEIASRLPEPDEIMGDGLAISSTTTLRPENSRNFNLGVTMDNQNNTNHLKFGLNYSFRDVASLIQLQQFDQSFFRYQNVDRARIQGLDATLEYSRNKKIKLGANYSFVHPIDKSFLDVNGDMNLNYNSALANISTNQSALFVRYQIENWIQKKSKINLNWSFNYVFEFNHSKALYGKYDLEIIPTQYIQNVSLVYTFPTEKMSISIDGHNITNQQAFDNYALQKAGRAFYIKILFRV